jgi:hypothetical protein
MYTFSQWCCSAVSILGYAIQGPCQAPGHGPCVRRANVEKACPERVPGLGVLGMCRCAVGVVGVVGVCHVVVVVVASRENGGAIPQFLMVHVYACLPRFFFRGCLRLSVSVCRDWSHPGLSSSSYDSPIFPHPLFIIFLVGFFFSAFPRHAIRSSLY